MTRINIITVAAFATTIGCADTATQMDTDALAASGFAGIERTLAVVPMHFTPENGQDGRQGSAWAPADLPAGTYWMTVEDVVRTEGDTDIESGDRQLSYVTSLDGVPMLQGTAPIMSNGEVLTANQVDRYTAPVEDGRCEVITALAAEGKQTGPDTFTMTVYFEDSVEGEDCFKLGYGEEKRELVEFEASYDFIPPVVEDPKDDDSAGPSDDPGNGDDPSNANF